MIAFVLGAVMMLSLAACGGNGKTDGNTVQMPVPFTEYASMGEAAAAAGFDLKAPESVEGYSREVIQVFDTTEDAMIEVIYSAGEDEDASTICIRKAAGSEDISGDYNQYAENNAVSVGESKVTMKGENGQVHLATWTNGGYTYSIGVYGENGISSDAMAGLAAAVQ